jgi:hypothetical protein
MTSFASASVVGRPSSLGSDLAAPGQTCPAPVNL